MKLRNEARNNAMISLVIQKTRQDTEKIDLVTPMKWNPCYNHQAKRKQRFLEGVRPLKTRTWHSERKLVPPLHQTLIKTGENPQQRNSFARRDRGLRFASWIWSLAQ